MTRIINRRNFILTLSLFICLGVFNALRPVYGHMQEDDLKKQVETLTQKTEEQKKALDTLKANYEKFRTSVIERDKSTRQLITEQGQKLDQKVAADAQNFGRLAESARQQDVALRQLQQALTQQRDAITNMNARLRAKGI